MKGWSPKLSPLAPYSQCVVTQAWKIFHAGSSQLHLSQHWPRHTQCGSSGKEGELWRVMALAATDGPVLLQFACYFSGSFYNSMEAAERVPAQACVTRKKHFLLLLDFYNVPSDCLSPSGEQSFFIPNMLCVKPVAPAGSSVACFST